MEQLKNGVMIMTLKIILEKFKKIKDRIIKNYKKIKNRLFGKLCECGKVK